MRLMSMYVVALLPPLIVASMILMPVASMQRWNEGKHAAAVFIGVLTVASYPVSVSLLWHWRHLWRFVRSET